MARPLECTEIGVGVWSGGRAECAELVMCLCLDEAEPKRRHKRKGAVCGCFRYLECASVGREKERERRERERQTMCQVDATQKAYGVSRKERQREREKQKTKKQRKQCARRTWPPSSHQVNCRVRSFCVVLPGSDKGASSFVLCQIAKTVEVIALERCLHSTDVFCSSPLSKICKVCKLPSAMICKDL